jgi:hypothetical protein
MTATSGVPHPDDADSRPAVSDEDVIRALMIWHDRSPAIEPSPFWANPNHPEVRMMRALLEADRSARRLAAEAERDRFAETARADARRLDFVEEYEVRMSLTYAGWRASSANCDDGFGESPRQAIDAAMARVRGADRA